MPPTMVGIIVTASDTFDLVPCAGRGRAEKLEATRYKARHTAHRRADTRRQFSYLARSIRPPEKIIDERALAVRKILKPIATKLTRCAFGMRNFSAVAIISYASQSETTYAPHRRYRRAEKGNAVVPKGLERFSNGFLERKSARRVQELTLAAYVSRYSVPKIYLWPKHLRLSK